MTTELVFAVRIGMKNAGPVQDLSHLEVTELVSELVEAGLEAYVRVQPWVLGAELLR